jgi:hypothetical protein
MKTYNEIKQALAQQNLVSMCSCNTTKEYNFFTNLVDVNAIERRVNRFQVSSYNMRYALYYILYDNDVDEFVLNITFIKRDGNEVLCDEELIGVAKWIKTADGYVLIGNTTHTQTRITMENLLPKIYKAVPTTTGCYMYTYNNAGPGIDECGGTQGTTVFYSNCGNINAYNKPTCDDITGCYAYADAGCTTIISDLYVYTPGECILTSDTNGLITATCCTGIC